MPRDDAGQACRAFVPPVLASWPSETMPRPLREKALADAGFPGVRKALLIGALYFPVLAGLAIASEEWARGGTLVLAACLLPVALSRALRPLGPRWRWAGWRRAVLTQGHCPSCGYVLGACRGGRRVCAECGATWHGP